MDDKIKNVEIKIKDYASIDKSVLDEALSEISAIDGVLDCKFDNESESIKYLISSLSSDYDVFSALMTICENHGIDLIFDDDDEVVGERNSELETNEEPDGENFEEEEAEDEELKKIKEKRYEKAENIIVLAISAILIVLGFIFEKSNADASMWIFMFGYALAGYETLYAFISDIAEKRYAIEKGLVLVSSFVVLYFGFRLLGCAIIFSYSLISCLYSVFANSESRLKEVGYTDEQIEIVKNKTHTDKKKLFIYDMILLCAGLLLVFIPPVFSGSRYWSTLTQKWLCIGSSVIFFGSLSSNIASLVKNYVFARVYAASNEIMFNEDKFEETLEKISSAEKICFDKTGVITVERGKVIGVETVNEMKFSEYLVTAEADLNDPIAKTIKEYYKDVNVVEKSNFEFVEGRGASFVVEGKTILVGSKKFLNKNNVAIDESIENPVVYVAENGVILGKIVVEFAIRENSYGAIVELEEDLGVGSKLLSADSKESVEMVKNAVGFDGAVSGATVNYKAESVKESNAIYVGNAIADKETIKRTRGIALGAMDKPCEGSSVSAKTADPKVVPTIIKLAKRTIKINKQNKIIFIASRVFFFLLGVVLTLAVGYRFAMFWAVIGVLLGDIAAFLNDCRNLTEVV